MESRRVQIGVGIFILITSLALAGLALKVSNLSQYANRDSYRLYAYFDNIGGLKIRSPVKVGGVIVGRVDTIDLDLKSMRPKVSMLINSRYHNFASETSASILTAGLLGEQYLSLNPGGNEELLKPGDVITDTQSAIVLEDLIGQFLFNKSSSDSL